MTALQLNNELVKEGHIIPVWNKDRPKFSNENRKYFVIHVESNDREFPIMLTEKELERAIIRATKNEEDVPKKNALVDILD